MIFAGRVSSDQPVRGPDEAVALARYLKSRNRYKRDLLDRLVEVSGDGPVLDWSGGYSCLGQELAREASVPTYRVCSDAWSARLAAKPRAAGYRGTVRAAGRALPFPAGAFRLVICINSLHSWDRPEGLFLEAHRLVTAGGQAVVNDLRRDADPFLAEYVLRELAGGPGRGARFGARAFARSLRSSYTPGEVRAALDRCGLEAARVDDDPMTLTAWIRGEGPS